jgi:hypothetical protein
MFDYILSSCSQAPTATPSTFTSDRDVLSMQQRRCKHYFFNQNVSQTKSQTALIALIMCHANIECYISASMTICISKFQGAVYHRYRTKLNNVFTGERGSTTYIWARNFCIVYRAGGLAWLGYRLDMAGVGSHCLAGCQQ